MEIVTYDIPQTVRVRKYDVDTQALCELLREHNAKCGFSNQDIVEKLCQPLTKVEHWFRKDKSFSIPDEKVWPKLKDLLQIQNNDFDLSIMTFEEKDNVYEKSNRLYDSLGLSPTITCADADLLVLDKEKNMEVNVIGQMDNTIDHTFESANRVYDKNGLAPTINTCGGGGLQPKAIDQVKELGFMDNGKVDMNPKLLGGIGEKWGDKQYRQGNCVYDANGVAMALTAQPLGNNGGNSYMYLTEEKSIVAMRGRNPENPSDRTVGTPTEQRLEPNSQGICNTLTSDGSSPKHNNRVMECVETQYCIRKLTPRECYRLMAVPEKDIDKMLEANSNTQCYKQAGNSIVVNCLIAIFSQMGIQGIPRWNDGLSEKYK